LAFSRVGLLVVLTAALASASAVGATAATSTIDFESLTGPSRFCPPAAPALQVGDATFSGGAILSAVEGLPANQTTVYGTAVGCGEGYECEITITFSSPVSNVEVDVFNGVLESAVSYTVTDNLGGSQTKEIAAASDSGMATFELSGSGITSVTISPTTGCTSDAWAFFIDNVRFDTVESPPPPPTVPTDKGECKNGGWEEFGVFRNQGDCVSYTATGGRNAPAGDLGTGAPEE
jgi:hypothetical protein